MSKNWDIRTADVATLSQIIGSFAPSATRGGEGEYARTTAQKWAWVLHLKVEQKLALSFQVYN